jgi:hypothetical protein
MRSGFFWSGPSSLTRLVSETRGKMMRRQIGPERTLERSGPDRLTPVEMGFGNYNGGQERPATKPKG